MSEPYNTQCNTGHRRAPAMTRKSMREAGFEPARGNTPQDPKACAHPRNTSTYGVTTAPETAGDRLNQQGTTTPRATRHQRQAGGGTDAMCGVSDATQPHGASVRQSRTAASAPVLAVLLLALVGCEPEPLARTTPNTNGFSADLMGTIEGCRVYAFGFNAFALLCGDSTRPRAVGTTSTHQQSCGKGCTRTIVTTVVAPADTGEVRP